MSTRVVIRVCMGDWVAFCVYGIVLIGAWNHSPSHQSRLRYLHREAILLLRLGQLFVMPARLKK